MESKKYLSYIENFFNLYEHFLLVDTTISVLAEGRSRDILGTFLLYFMSIVADKKNEQEIVQYQDEVKLLLENYVNINSKNIVNCYSINKSSNYAHITSKISTDLNNSFKAFFKAAELYESHRNKLTQQEIIEIYEKNALDYYLTAFGNNTQDEFKASLKTYIASKQANGVRLLKQSLMEFNNSISHLYSAWKKSSVDKNLERAQHHLNRGALDFYKSIIKELSMLGKINDSNLKSLKQLRCSEYNSIGEERHKATINPPSLYNKYYDFCSKIIGS